MKRYSAFTLIETLIAIVVFGIGILAVLHGLFQTLRNQEYANMQIESAFLAREGIELMFNLRDANYRKELPWNCIFEPKTFLRSNYEEYENPFCGGYFGSGDDNNVLKIGIGSGEYIHIETGKLNEDFDTNFETFQIFFHTGDVINNATGFIYNHEGNEERGTRFARYLVITGVLYEENNDKPLDKDTLLKVESHVLYKKGHLTGEKVMETFIGNYEF